MQGRRSSFVPCQDIMLIYEAGVASICTFRVRIVFRQRQLYPSVATVRVLVPGHLKRFLYDCVGCGGAPLTLWFVCGRWSLHTWGFLFSPVFPVLVRHTLRHKQPKSNTHVDVPYGMRRGFVCVQPVSCVKWCKSDIFMVH